MLQKGMAMISCDQSDYIEIACLYRIPVTLRFTDKPAVTGVPLDTGYDAKKHERLLMRIGTTTTWVDITHLSSMTAVRANPYFDHINMG